MKDCKKCVHADLYSKIKNIESKILLCSVDIEEEEFGLFIGYADVSIFNPKDCIGFKLREV